MLRKRLHQRPVTKKWSCLRQAPWRPMRRTHNLGLMRISYVMNMVSIMSVWFYCLTHWGREQMPAIFQTIISNGFSWMKMCEFRLSQKFVPKGPINNIPALVQIMAWRRPGDKPLSKPVVVSLLTHICITLPQWIIPCTEFILGDMKNDKRTKSKNVCTLNSKGKVCTLYWFSTLSQ